LFADAPTLLVAPSPNDQEQAVEPVRHWIRQVSEPGEVVFDPRCGSGTTGVEALMEGRRFLGGDLDPGCVETTGGRLVEVGDELALPNSSSELSPHYTT